MFVHTVQDHCITVTGIGEAGRQGTASLLFDKLFIRIMDINIMIHGHIGKIAKWELKQADVELGRLMTQLAPLKRNLGDTGRVNRSRPCTLQEWKKVDVSDVSTLLKGVPDDEVAQLVSRRWPLELFVVTTEIKSVYVLCQWRKHCSDPSFSNWWHQVRQEGQGEVPIPWHPSK